MVAHDERGFIRTEGITGSDEGANDGSGDMNHGAMVEAEKAQGGDGDANDAIDENDGDDGDEHGEEGGVERADGMEQRSVSKRHWEGGGSHGQRLGARALCGRRRGLGGERGGGCAAIRSAACPSANKARKLRYVLRSLTLPPLFIYKCQYGITESHACGATRSRVHPRSSTSHTPPRGGRNGATRSVRDVPPREIADQLALRRASPLSLSVQRRHARRRVCCAAAAAPPSPRLRAAPAGQRHLSANRPSSPTSLPDDTDTEATLASGASGASVAPEPAGDDTVARADGAEPLPVADEARLQLPDLGATSRRRRRKPVQKPVEQPVKEREVLATDAVQRLAAAYRAGGKEAQKVIDELEKDPDYFLQTGNAKGEYDFASALIGTGKPNKQGIYVQPYLQSGHVLLLGIVLLIAFVYYPGFPLTEASDQTRDLLKKGLAIVSIANSVLAVYAYRAAKLRAQPPFFWAVKTVFLGNLAFNELKTNAPLVNDSDK
ncbi:hypothetical protein FGB62_25g718 [Gracilaria domingensis]|nr:hypothetical protein FGB62_25g718 [Gracilaria domingensis]